MAKLEIFVSKQTGPPQIITVEGTFTLEVSLRDHEGQFFRSEVMVQNFSGREAIEMLRTIANQLEEMTEPPVN
jgi:hypothetical protein